MTQLMNARELRDAAANRRHVPAKPDLALRWTVEEATGRVVSHWVAVERDVYCFFSDIALAL